jgi:hypothetical protein
MVWLCWKGIIEILAILKKYSCYSPTSFRCSAEIFGKENKPHGFEALDIRLGGLMLRFKYFRERIETYLRDEKGTLPEIEEVLLDFWGNGSEHCKQNPCYSEWGLIVLVNQM